MQSRSMVRARLYAPPAQLAQYFRYFSLVENGLPPDRATLDHVLPEWGSLSFASNDGVTIENYAGVRVSGALINVMAPRRHAVRFEMKAGRYWSMALTPLGWVRYVGVAAGDMAEAVIDYTDLPALAGFRAMADTLYAPEPDAEQELGRLTASLLAEMRGPVADAARIEAIHTALIDTDLATVAQLVERVGASARTIERVCHRAFGFSPKVLLRRQRFMRSLSHYMRDPAGKWIDALDGQYYDQAQFVREFREFMGMTPRQYAAMDHPVMAAFLHEWAGNEGITTTYGGAPKAGHDTPDAAPWLPA